MPLLTVAYMLQFLDKVSLSYASIMGIIQDLVRDHHVPLESLLPATFMEPSRERMGHAPISRTIHLQNFHF